MNSGMWSLHTVTVSTHKEHWFSPNAMKRCLCITFIFLGALQWVMNQVGPTYIIGRPINNSRIVMCDVHMDSVKCWCNISLFLYMSSYFSYNLERRQELIMFKFLFFLLAFLLNRSHGTLTLFPYFNKEIDNKYFLEV